MVKRGKKRKKRGSSDCENSSPNKCNTSCSEGGPASVQNISVSDILREANGVLFNMDDNNSSKMDDDTNTSVFVNNENGDAARAGTSESEPTNRDIMNYLLTLGKRLGTVEERLQSLKVVEEKVEGFDKELKKLWTAIMDRDKAVNDRVTKIEERNESIDFNLGMVNSKVVDLEKKNEMLNNEVTYLRSQSMRNNLLFSNIPEPRDETAEQCEATVRKFIHEKLKVAKDLVDKLGFERVHRFAGRVGDQPRKIVAKFTLFKEREMVRRQWKCLQGTPYYMNEQFPKPVADKRKELLPKMKAARKDGKTAWIAYDTLYIDGRAVRD